MDEINLNFRLPFATLFFGLFLAAAIAGLVTYLVPGTGINAFVAIYGLGVATTTLVYGALQFNLNNRIRREELRLDRLDKALDFMAAMSEPSMAKVLQTSGDIIKILNSETEKSPSEIVESSESNRAAAISALNYLERLAITVRFDAADEQMLRDFFSVPVRRSWHGYKDWIRSKRQEWQTDDLFTELEWLADRWKKAT